MSITELCILGVRAYIDRLLHLILYIFLTYGLGSLGQSTTHTMGSAGGSYATGIMEPAMPCQLMIFLNLNSSAKMEMIIVTI